jgi:hypothetical protein
MFYYRSSTGFKVVKDSVITNTSAPTRWLQAGKNNGWPGEKWLDIRQLSVLEPIMSHRLDLCKAKGFNAVEPDDIDGYSNSTGFPLSYQEQLTYNK